MPDTITSKQLRGLVQSFPWDDWEKELEPGFTQLYRDLVVTQGGATAEDAGVEFDADDPFLQEHMTSYVGERISQLTRTTQKEVTRSLQSALANADDNLSTDDLRDLVLNTVRDKFSDYESYRALRIARTESAIGYNHGSVLGGIQGGFEKFDVTDGTDDEECAAANGQVWSADECLDDPVAHPNCVRVFTPHAEDDDESDG